MPPDRTTSSSFIHAAATGAALSSHGAGHAPSLERGKACLVCRTRKVKCDGVKPCCGACRRSAVTHGDDPSLIVCNFDEPDPTTKRRRGAGGQAKVKELQDKIAELESIIAQANGSGQPQASESQQPVASTSAQPFNTPPLPMIQSIEQFTLPTTQSSFDILLQASQPHPTAHSSYISNYSDISGFNPNYGMPSAPTTGDSAPSSHDDTTFYDILYPGWPRDLPSPALTTRLLEVYFNKSHVASGMINAHRFMSAMTLPPTRPGFPQPCLIHAMLANSTRMISEDFFLGEPKYWGKTDILETMSDYHAKRAKFHIDDSIANFAALLQTTQSVVLLCFYAYTSARFVEVWLNCGLAARCTAPLGLTHLRPASAGTYLRPAHLKPSMLPPTDDPIELQERAYTFWLSFMVDRFTSASTGWSMGYDESDITTLLPSATMLNTLEFDQQNSPLSPRNPNFLISHPPQLVGGFQIFMKAVILLGRIVTFLQRSPTPTAWIVGRPETREMPMDLRMSREFKQLDADAVSFRLSIPREYLNVRQYAPLDTRLCLVFALPHTATILLHEPWCTTQEGDVSMARCLLSARAVLEGIYDLFSASFEIGILAPFINFAWAVAGRTLVRELAIKQSKGVSTGQVELKMDINMILSAMRAHRSPLGVSVAASLQRLFDDPSLCLPHAEIRTSGATYHGVCPGDFPYNKAYPPPTTSAPSSTSSPKSVDMPPTPNQFSQHASASTLSAMLYGPTPLSDQHQGEKDMGGGAGPMSVGGLVFDLDAMGPFTAGQWESS